MAPNVLISSPTSIYIHHGFWVEGAVTLNQPSIWPASSAGLETARNPRPPARQRMTVVSMAAWTKNRASVGRLDTAKSKRKPSMATIQQENIGKIRKTFFPSHLLGFRSVYLHDSPVLGAFLARTPQKSGLSQKKGYPWVSLFPYKPTDNYHDLVGSTSLDQPYSTKYAHYIPMVFWLTQVNPH